MRKSTLKVGIILFLFIFGVPLTGFPLNTAKISLIIITPLVLLNIRSRRALWRIIYSKASICVVLCIVFLVIYSAWWPTILGTGDFRLSYIYFIMLIERYLGAVLVISYASKFDIKIDGYIKIIIYVLIVQSAIILLMFLSEEVRTLLWSLNGRSDLKDISERYGSIRALGFAGGVTYTMSVILSCGVILISFHGAKFGKRYWHVPAAVLLVFAMLFSGRTGWLGVAIAIGLFFLVNGYERLFRSISSVILKFTPLLLVSLSIGYNYLPQQVVNTIQNDLIPFAFEIFINLYSTGQLTASSLEATQEMYFPITEWTFWFGDARWKSLPGASYRHYRLTDSGYMHHVLFYGALGSIVFYGFYIFVFIRTAVVGGKMWGGRFFAMTMSLMIYFFVVQWKGDILALSSMNTKLIFILFAIVTLAYCRHRTAR
ncbi:hypothetical protein GGQ21_002680 [Salinibacter ruber]|uniref:hypothetical protein n=1 Tax=Salinibacter ruber TaxID=146919 RepID=UPI002073DA76|nr:hypothetical protein [Salinibacter ruber]MCS3672010.1 hypothetical protein [Salinibacter ruber]